MRANRRQSAWVLVFFPLFYAACGRVGYAPLTAFRDEGGGWSDPSLADADPPVHEDGIVPDDGDDNGADPLPGDGDSISPADDAPPDFCQGVSCSDHGECSAVGDHPFCDCASGYANSTATTCVPWWDDAWTFRRQLLFDNSAQSEDLFDFPVLVTIAAPAVDDFGFFSPSGTDLRFVSADHLMVLPHEVEQWSQGDAVAWVWLRVPLIHGGATTDYVWMYYGNDVAADEQDSTGVWSNDFAAVWHLADDPGTGVMRDSTAHAKHGAPANMTVDNSIDALIGPGYRFDGSSSVVRVAAACDDTLAFSNGELTFEAVVRVDALTAPGWSALLGKQFGTTSADTISISIEGEAPDDLYMYWRSPDAGAQGASTAGMVALGSWRYLAVTRSPGNVAMYRDGQSLLTTAMTGTGIVCDGNPITIGAEEFDDTTAVQEYFSGSLDELRLSNQVRSADWIAAQHLSMSGQLVTIGAPETL